MTQTWAELLCELERELGESHGSNESRLILRSSTALAWGYLAAHLDEPADPEAAALAYRRLGERLSGRPLQWVLGTWGFRTIDVVVDGRALVPRPETETVVEVALEELDRVATERRAAEDLLALDLGTGSGVIALSLAVERRGVRVVATDRSPDALSLAAENRARLAAERDPTLTERVELIESDWFAGLRPEMQRGFDLVVSNPPYIGETEWSNLDPVVRDHDPYDALVAGPAGTEAVQLLVAEAPHWLRPGGALVLEMAPAQVGLGRAWAEAGGFAEVDVARDLAGRPRALVSRLRR